MRIVPSVFRHFWRNYMLVSYLDDLLPAKASVLEHNGWKTVRNQQFEKYSSGYDNGLYMGIWSANGAEKEFNAPKDAMLEIERLLDCDVVADTDHDGCPVHSFAWIECEERKVAMGWDCAIQIYGAPPTARETAMELALVRGAMDGRGQVNAIAAVRIVRAITGLGLKAAKEIVDKSI